jgi:hypothetical protein
MRYRASKTLSPDHPREAEVRRIAVLSGNLGITVEAADGVSDLDKIVRRFHIDRNILENRPP